MQDSLPAGPCSSCGPDQLGAQADSEHAPAQQQQQHCSRGVCCTRHPPLGFGPF